jgi:Ni/Co efflux regulator RcnB
MRKFAIALLLAGAATATPAIAGPHDWGDRHESRDDSSSHQSSHEQHSQARSESHFERSDNRPQFNGNNHPQPQVQMPQQNFTAGGGDHDNGRRVRGDFAGTFNGRDHGRRDHGDSANGFGGNSSADVAPGPRVVTAPGGEGGQFRQRGFRERELRRSERSFPQVLRDRHPLVVSDTPRPGTQPPLRAESGRHHDVRWSTNWRNDHRYDWRDRRRHHRSLFHLGLFIDPFGWDYQPFSIGYRMWPAYYGNQYWIDPGLYGLPYPPPGCVWIRYWNDAILVDMYSGTTLDVIPNFFW